MIERKNYLPILLLAGIFILSLPDVTFAADNNSAVNQITGGLSGGGAGFGTTFQTQLNNLAKSLLSSAQIIAVIMTATAGCMVCFGIEDGKKTFWNWILGIGLAINFGDLILSLWSVESPSAPTKIEDYKLLLKSEDDPSIDILSPFMRYYIGVIMSGAAVIAPYAINLTLLLATIDGAIKFSFDLISGDKIKFLVMTILKVGFYIFLIQSWVGTNSNFQLMPVLSSGFETMGYTAGGAEEMVKAYSKASPDSNIEVQSNQIVTNALNFFNIFWEHAQTQNILTILVGLICVVAAVVILFLAALEMFMVRIEFWTMALLTIPLLSFGVISQLKFLRENNFWFAEISVIEFLVRGNYNVNNFWFAIIKAQKKSKGGGTMGAGRPKSNNAKTENLHLRLTKNELEEICSVADKLKITKTEAILRGIKLLKNPPKQEIFYRSQMPNFKPKKIPKVSEGIEEGEVIMFNKKN